MEGVAWWQPPPFASMLILVRGHKDTDRESKDRYKGGERIIFPEQHSFEFHVHISRNACILVGLQDDASK